MRAWLVMCTDTQVCVPSIIGIQVLIYWNVYCFIIDDFFFHFLIYGLPVFHCASYGPSFTSHPKLSSWVKYTPICAASSLTPNCNKNKTWLVTMASRLLCLLSTLAPAPATVFLIGSHLFHFRSLFISSWAADFLSSGAPCQSCFILFISVPSHQCLGWLAHLL